MVAPFLILSIYTNQSVINWVEQITGRDIDSFTMSRYTIVQHVLNGIDSVNFGFGTTVYMLNDWAAKSLHSDVLRLYLEVNFLSTIVYTYAYFKFVRNYNLFTFLVIFHIFSEGLFNHWMFGAGITCQWIIIYLIIYTINRHGESLETVKYRFK